MGWLSVVVTTIPVVYTLSFKISLRIQKKREYEVVTFSWSIDITNLIYRYLITLTLGPKSLQPCPICLVPAERLDLIDLDFARRHTITCKETYEEALCAQTEAEATRICKAYGICKVKVC